mmetsp:Transcript_75427/g.232804  ORF Transcript_75427/g.232804 Transcript_75427/m.232804 type:complete len:180 (-) Transcript_75427:298-837(-)
MPPPAEGTCERGDDGATAAILAAILADLAPAPQGLSAPATGGVRARRVTGRLPLRHGERSAGGLPPVPHSGTGAGPCACTGPGKPHHAAIGVATREGGVRARRLAGVVSRAAAACQPKAFIGSDSMLLEQPLLACGSGGRRSGGGGGGGRCGGHQRESFSSGRSHGRASCALWSFRARG